jgi:Tol biopolymer transport system component/putative hemolysin
MKNRLYTLGIILVLGSLLISGCRTSEVEPTIGLANPASVYCEEQGYTLEMRTDENGDYGVCIFPDGSECEEWAFYRGECGPGTGEAQPTEVPVTPTEVPVTPTEAPVQVTETSAPSAQPLAVAWYGYVASTPEGAQFDDYLVLLPEGAGREIGIEGADETVQAEIVALRDQGEPGKYANFWGTLNCDVPDYGGCQLLVTRLRVGGPGPFFDPDPVEGWQGTIVGAPYPEGPRSGGDDYLVVLIDGIPIEYGIHSLDDTLAAQIESLRDTGTVVRVWGQINAGVPDWNATQIQVDRLEIAAEAPSGGEVPVVPTETPLPLSALGQIAFMSNLHLQEREGVQAYVMNADGSDPHRLTSGLGWQGPLSWSPDGKAIACARGGDIWVMDADGSNPRNLTNYEAGDQEPAWSPDGQYIAFTSNRAGRVSGQAYATDIYVMNAHGSDPRNLTDSATSDTSPAWSPDGSHIAFQSDRDGNWEIYVMEADGSDPRNLTNHEGNDYLPAWSPDGSTIAFDSERDGDREIYLMDADGSNLRRLTDRQGMDGLPIWSPDGRYIAFQSNRGGESQEICVMELESGEVQCLTEHMAFMADWSPLPR